MVADERNSHLPFARIDWRGENFTAKFTQHGAVTAFVAIINHHSVVETSRVKFQFEVYKCKLDDVFFFDDVLWNLNSPAAYYLIRISVRVLWRMK